ncbi:BTB/POZ domain-containing protein 17-like [Mercenaria mercenaria]|uniref:BTB/POZ domain-containing protein 17-like n=1 Tax=Mercenaria mercenaria TaxID=6596 RepID=UPI00234F8266|nr:BTB/POZ domain-containing protein 17-like [Mercenaria mercenaria]XP_045202762.2 BTB/POZ domain-containing protein 17-like [Mercenaria mercenaria]XP_045202763.2 BTB/POZ domain-containing protein 17-like [Mercenaria mercenaria]XP_045202764.2 BTB/POZ domain-containing protein 17-like [Mercenaria mercenaria]XP_045202765.2 BTB/POZ domain-containing protein 17-like [Mercenaria mercenaria]XP_045202766.2 BTB/POZ domain-containing protein 17-like [Mercenaria mercenaria]XP_045202767.2 BTB/POZ domain
MDMNIVEEIEIVDTGNDVDLMQQVLRDDENFIRNVSQFFNQKDLSDVTITVGEQSYFGHKFVLAKSSDVFRTMLYGDGWTQGQDQELILTESDECQAVFDVFLRFMYTAEVTVTVDTAVGILCLADKYNVTSLKSLCVGYMIQNTQSPRVHNALHWYNWAKALHLEDLVESCTKTIAWNIEAILGSTEWHNMDLQFIRDILNNSGLVVANEYLLYTGLVSWLQYESHEENLRENAEALLPLIRFPQMLVSQLYNIELSDFFELPEVNCILKELVNKAYRYRSLCPTQVKLDVTFDGPFYKPRNYMDLAVDSVLMQNTLRFGIQVDVRTYAGPVVSENRNGEWKITYRKHENNWTINLFCHESATINGEAFIEVCVLIFNDEEKVIQVDMVPATVCTRTNNLGLNVNVDNPAASKNMVLLIKPVPH